MSEREPGKRGAGRLAAAGGAVLLLVAGFVVGLVVGAAFEDPDLVLGSLAGRGTTVPLEAPDAFDAGEASRAGDAFAADEARRADDASAASESPEREAARAAGGAADPEATAEVSAGPPRAALRPAGGPPRGWAIQVGAFTDAAAAERLAARLREQEIDVYVAHDAPGGRPRFRVRVGPLESEAAARELAKQLEKQQRLPTWVLREEGA